jgi:protein SCO1/2
MKLISILYVFAIEVVAVAAPLSQLPPQLREIGIDQRLGSQLPLDARFRNEDGDTVSLGSFFHGKPVVLALVYYECPMLCNRILSGVTAGLQPLRLRAGRDFEVVAVSINPRETPVEAKAKRNQFTSAYSGKAGSPGWHFLVGDPDSIKAVTEAAGFHYRWDPETQMYIHASAIMIATPEGVLARYFYGVEYTPKDLKLGLIESSGGTIGSPVDKVLLFCYHYDPMTGKYGAVVMNVLRAGGAVTVVVLGTVLFWLWRRERYSVPQGG